MKIQIFKKQNDENVYYIFDSYEEKLLNFESIKYLSIDLLNRKMLSQSIVIDIVISEATLEIYKLTLENVLKSIEEDDELFELYRNQHESEVTIIQEEAKNDQNDIKDYIDVNTLL